MTREELQKHIDHFADNSPHNFIAVRESSRVVDGISDNNYEKNNLATHGISTDMLGVDEDSELKGMRFYQRPIFSIGRADHPDFAKIKQPEVVGVHHLMPEDWLPEAKTVISVFLPFEQATVDANKVDPFEPAIEWVYTRVDGQRFLLALGAMIRDVVTSAGYKAVTPYTEDRYIMRTGSDAEPGTEHVPQYSTNWSERHVGVVTGLGTFGQSTNFISKAGCAGRLISIITDWDIEPDILDYNGWLGYCNDCGACIRRCPGNAYFPDRHGKDHEKCREHIRKACQRFFPRYGCGKCQSGLPCDNKPMPKDP